MPEDPKTHLQKLMTGIPYCLNVTWNGEGIEAGGHPDDPSYQVIVPVETIAVWCQGTLTEDEAFAIVRKHIKIKLYAGPVDRHNSVTERHPLPPEAYLPPGSNPRPFGAMLDEDDTAPVDT